MLYNTIKGTNLIGKYLRDVKSLEINREKNK